jgi:hypothetical protein
VRCGFDVFEYDKVFPSLGNKGGPERTRIASEPDVGDRAYPNRGSFRLLNPISGLKLNLRFGSTDNAIPWLTAGELVPSERREVSVGNGLVTANKPGTSRYSENVT